MKKKLNGMKNLINGISLLKTMSCKQQQDSFKMLLKFQMLLKEVSSTIPVLKVQFLPVVSTQFPYAL